MALRYVRQEKTVREETQRRHDMKRKYGEGVDSERQRIFMEAMAYLSLYYREQEGFDGFIPRMARIHDEIMQTGTYWQGEEELAYGARVAWRNNSRCIGRLHWNSLTVRDMRHVQTAEEVYEALVEHIRAATNGGKIRSTISIFAPQVPGEPGIRIWNPQLIRYAGYRQPNGQLIGDPMQEELSEIARQLGWQGGPGTPFDVLPLIIQMPHQRPMLFELPHDAILEVPLTHPEYAWFEELGLKWHALPVISNMRLEVGGVSYTAAPFNGWYMGTEIGARNLGDVERYNLLPVIAEKMGLKKRLDRELWKDRALVELNIAVLSSFARDGVTIIDHHTASRQFMHHQRNEEEAGRVLPADWSWIVPPMSGSVTPVFHIPYKDCTLSPNFFPQPDPWKEGAASHMDVAQDQRKSACPVEIIS